MLYIINGPMGGRNFPLREGSTFVGRSPENDIRIHDGSISRKHLRISKKGGAYFVEDLNSQNGTWIGGEPTTPGREFRVEEGNPIALGKIFISLGRAFAVEEKASQVVVNLSEYINRRGANFFYKDRRFMDRKKLEMICEVSALLMESSDIREISDKIMEAIFSCLKRIDSGVLLLLDPQSDRFTEIASRSRTGSSNTRIRYSRTIVSRVFKEGKAVMISDTGREEKRDLSESIETMRIKSIMCVPLISKSETLGVIYVHSVNVPRGFKKEDLYLLTGLSAPVALALENALLHSRQRQIEKAVLETEKIDSIKTLAGGIAHNFNNLLMGIQGNASLMMMDLDPNHPNYSKLKNIERCVSRGAELIEQLVGFAREGKYEARPMDLNGLIKGSSELFARVREEVRVYKRLQKDLWEPCGDRRQIGQVLSDLYDNAWRSMGGRGRLFLETRNVLLSEKEAAALSLAPGKYVRFTMRDTGKGMDEETRKSLFDPLAGAMETGTGGGCGLAAAMGIIRRHRGALAFQGEEGQGTRFEIYLPVPCQEDRSGVPTPEGDGRTILLVDDDETVLSVVGAMIEREGYRVLSARSGREALTLYERNRREIGMVVLDMIMPDMGGTETYNRLKELDPEIKVLLSSAYSVSGRVEALLERGCRGFIQKPFKIQELSMQLRKIMNRDTVDPVTGEDIPAIESMNRWA